MKNYIEVSTFKNQYDYFALDVVIDDGKCCI